MVIYKDCKGREWIELPFYNFYKLKGEDLIIQVRHTDPDIDIEDERAYEENDEGRMKWYPESDYIKILNPQEYVEWEIVCILDKMKIKDIEEIVKKIKGLA